jgi:23S rRNA pseudouridine2605 synthase
MTATRNKQDSAGKGERIAKVLARAGVASRREVERMIAEGRVALDGAPVEKPQTLVLDTKGITVDGKPVKDREPSRLWRYNKPRGLVTTNRDPEGRKTVFDALPGKLPRVLSVGRLDINSEGLLILTNDGALARWMELPKTGWKRRYRVRVHGNVDEARLKALSKGITVEGVTYGPIEARLERQQGSNAWLEMGLREGKNREVRKVLEAMGLKVTRLIRTAYGPMELGSLAGGEVDEMPVVALRSFFPKDLTGSVAAWAKPKAERSKGPRGPRGPQRSPGTAKPGRRTLRARSPGSTGGKRK